MLVYWRVTQCTTFHPLLISFDGVLIQHLARSICQARPLILGMDLIDLYVFCLRSGGLATTGSIGMAPSHLQYFTARCAMAPSHLQYFTCRFAMAPSHLQYFTARCAMAPSHLQIFHLQYWDGTFSPAIFELRWHLLTCNILPADLRWHLLTCNILWRSFHARPIFYMKYDPVLGVVKTDILWKCIL